MKRSICTACHEPITLVLDRGRYQWRHDAGRVWPESHGHEAVSTPALEAVSA